MNKSLDGLVVKKRKGIADFLRTFHPPPFTTIISFVKGRVGSVVQVDPTESGVVLC